LSGFISAQLKTGALRLNGFCGISSGNPDVFCHAAAVIIVNAVCGVAFHIKAILRRFEKIAEHTALFLVKTSAAGIALVPRCQSLYHDGAFTAAVFCVMHTASYITVQFCHDHTS
jgi:hypothetical protein